MFLANSAEVRDGLLYVMGGVWDTVNVHDPLEGEGVPEGVVAVIAGSLVARLEFHITEAGKSYPLQITIVDVDGTQIAQASGEVRAEKLSGIPPQWPIGLNVVVPLTGIALPHFTEYRIDVMVGNEHKAEQPFRVLKLY